MVTGNRWRMVDRWMRPLHLYTGLFLAPRMIVYAMSAGYLNHGRWLNEKLDAKPPEWKIERQENFVPDESFPQDAVEQAEAILDHLDLAGAHRIQGKPGPAHMVILRISGGGHFRITWRRKDAQLVVERQQPFSVVRLIHFLHFRSGYGQSYPAHITWAVIVDAVSLSLVAGFFSGIYLWWRRSRHRLLESISLLAGGILFAVLVYALCS